MPQELAPLERVLSSGGRVKILTILSQVEELHLTEIAERTGQSYSATERHLEDLTETGMVQEHDYGRVRIFKLSPENPRALMLRNLILQWNNTLRPVGLKQEQA